MRRILLLAGIPSLIGIIIIVWFMLDLPFNDGSNIRDASLFGQYGDFIGGLLGTVFTIFGFIILIISFFQQRDQFRQLFNEQRNQFNELTREQRQQFQNERFESRLFEMIKYHRENVNEMYTPNTENGKYVEPTTFGKRTFKYILDQISAAIREIDPYFHNVEAEEVFERPYLESIKENREFNARNIEIKEIGKLNLAYLIVFFGVHKEGYITISKFLSNKYKPSFYIPILDFVQLKPVHTSKFWSIWENKISNLPIDKREFVFKEISKHRTDNTLPTIDFDLFSTRIPVAVYYYTNNYFKYYGGHQFRLGHYFRHYFQAINYINDAIGIPYQERYRYAKIYRAQLSTYEQAVFFFNSLSFMGIVWELSTDKNHMIPFEEIEGINSQLITKYNLIKNIPGEIIGETIRFQDYYPDVEYELSDITQRKIELKRLYR
jgi:hypothetical protein